MDGYAVEEASGAVISFKGSPLNSSDRLFLGYGQAVGVGDTGTLGRRFEWARMGVVVGSWLNGCSWQAASGGAGKR